MVHRTDEHYFYTLLEAYERRREERGSEPRPASPPVGHTGIERPVPEAAASPAPAAATPGTALRDAALTTPSTVGPHAEEPSEGAWVHTPVVPAPKDASVYPPQSWGPNAKDAARDPPAPPSPARYQVELDGGGAMDVSAPPRAPTDVGESDLIAVRMRRMSAVLKAWGWKFVNVKGDGNCQFSALSVQLHGSPDCHASLRAQAVAHIKKHREHYESYILDCSFEDYCKKMMRQFTWGDHLTLQALADYLSLSILVVTVPANADPVASPATPTHLLHRIQPRAAGAGTRQVILAFFQENHYMSVHDVEEETISSFVSVPRPEKRVAAPSQLERDLLNHTLEQEMGFRMICNAEDNLSMYRAVAVSLTHSTDVNTVCRIRHDSVSELRARQDLYAHKHEDFEKYLRTLERGDKPGDHRVLRALANAYNADITVAVAQGDGGVRLTGIIPDAPKGSPAPVWLGNYGGSVYQPVFRAV
eukprot:TRINITY_DN16292_c0_g2_i1.p1 TRINITY_DN16292_c0_g2~~TRINITY_DN16292_c0_g2_i1.p1  ORF type:complete len:514 (+),score=125.93 TRINITY_DN16292_c0_g2_i1:120-1544(+)